MFFYSSRDDTGRTDRQDIHTTQQQSVVFLTATLLKGCVFLRFLLSAELWTVLVSYRLVVGVDRSSLIWLFLTWYLVSYTQFPIFAGQFEPFF